MLRGKKHDSNDSCGTGSNITKKKKKESKIRKRIKFLLKVEKNENDNPESNEELTAKMTFLL